MYANMMPTNGVSERLALLPKISNLLREVSHGHQGYTVRERCVDVPAVVYRDAPWLRYHKLGCGNQPHLVCGRVALTRRPRAVLIIVTVVTAVPLRVCFSFAPDRTEISSSVRQVILRCTISTMRTGFQSARHYVIRYPTCSGPVQTNTKKSI